MSGLSKVIVVVPEDAGVDARAARQLALGFEREGVPTAIASGAAAVAENPGLVVVSGTTARSLELVRKARRVLDEQKSAVPLVFAGGGVARAEATAAGADEVVLLPTYLRDVVTIGRLLRAQPAGHRTALVGSLAETTGVYTLVRALCALGRSAVLTLIRGLRRGEIRFFHGEVTSAQVGLIHGQAAFHQLLLWTEARFEYHHEDIVRRQQIPLSAEELFADAERFLEGVRDASGALSPSLVLEQDVAAIQTLGTTIPSEVHGVLRMFDGHRVLADILEDSPYRVFETLRVAQRAVDAGLLRIVETQRAKATWRAVLRIEEWLVGAERPGPAVDTGPIARDTGPVLRESGPMPAPARGSSRRKRKKKRASAPPPAATPPPAASPLKRDIDWGALVPRTLGAELAPLSGVVPAAHTSGEIELPTREAPREKLEALMNTEKRDRIFPMDAGLEPSVVFDDSALAEAEAKAEAKAEAEDAQLRAEAAEWARQQAAARAKAVDAQAREDEDLARRVAATKAKVEEPRVIGSDEDTLDDADDAAIWAAAKARAETADAVDMSFTGAINRVSLDDTSDGTVQRIPTVETTPLPRPKPPKPADIPDDRPGARQGEIASRPTHSPADPRASEPSILVGDLGPAPTASESTASAPATTAATPRAPTPSTPAASTASAPASTATASTASTPATTAPASAASTPSTDTPASAASTPSTATPASTASTPSTATPASTASTAASRASTPATTGAASAASVPASTASTSTASTPSTTAAASTASAPATIAAASRASTPSTTAAASAASTPSTIAAASPTSAPAPSAASSSPAPQHEAPQHLVADLAAAHAAIAQVANAQAQAPATADLASASTELAVSDIRHGAQAAIADAASAFSDAEEAFFRAGHERPRNQPELTGPVETFDDLDEDYQPVGFWDRLRGKKPK